LPQGRGRVEKHDHIELRLVPFEIGDRGITLKEPFAGAEVIVRGADRIGGRGA
jgi:hypothetical protein